MHDNFDAIREDRFDCSAKYTKSGLQMVLEFLGVMGGTWLLYSYLENFKMFHPLIPKQLPGEGKVHYTFERE